MIIHTVKAGETVSSIAQQYGVPQFVVTALNNLESVPSLVVGQALLILVPLQFHTVDEDETVFSIAQQYGISVNRLYRNNPILRGQPILYPGQTLVIAFETDRTRRIDVNGYAYPYVDRNLLRSTLPYINYFTPFTYGITESGELVDLDDEELIAIAKEYGVIPLMHLSTLTEEGGFSNQLASLVLNNTEIQNNLVSEVIENMERKGYGGLDIDFEFVFPQDAVLYGEFIGKLRENLNPLGYEVIAALAPKTSDNQRGILYEGHNYRAIGDNADAVLLMTYEWGYTYGPPLAVAPIRNVRQVVDYAIGIIPTEKIFLGIPNYGYDWTLPYVKGESMADSISHVEAIQLAARFGAEIQYDEFSQSPWFRYTDEEEKVHEVWFEDVRSVQQKFNLINEKNLRGAGYWNLMRPFQQNWSLLDYMFDVTTSGN
ncbi:MAG: LysM peptidoglycan-binding domain-containing protein [Clostridia bacterium]|nr:LysM peptidoglycan-binding domain-containing protein [Clostridia bacterium]